jgi:rhizosphere induced protein
MAGSATYSLRFQNDSSFNGSAMIYQTDPGLGVPNVLSLAWFSRYAPPTKKVLFQWTLDYGFVWAETGTLVPGVMFVAAQYWPADLASSNAVTLTSQGGSCTFVNQKAGPRPGTLFINEDSTIPLKKVAVGIGMSGSGTFAVQAMPNFQLAFTPQPQYWIAFGDYAQGEVLDIGAMANAAAIRFPSGVYAMTAVLNKDGSWTVQPG